MCVCYVYFATRTVDARQLSTLDTLSGLRSTFTNNFTFHSDQDSEQCLAHYKQISCGEVIGVVPKGS